MKKTIILILAAVVAFTSVASAAETSIQAVPAAQKPKKAKVDTGKIKALADVRQMIGFLVGFRSKHVIDMDRYQHEIVHIRDERRGFAGGNGMIFFAFDLAVEKKLEFRVCHNGGSGVNTVNKRNVLFELELGFGVAFLAVLFTVFVKNRKKAVGFVGGTDKFIVDIKGYNVVFFEPV